MISRNPAQIGLEHVRLRTGKINLEGRRVEISLYCSESSDKALAFADTRHAPSTTSVHQL